MAFDEHKKADTMALHWQDIPRKGLGELLCKVNHIALVVSDVGRSLWFYSDILGFQQIRRPNFDRHGAWLTMGNVELHLILGNPVVHSGKDLIVGHISVETNNVKGVLEKLEEMGIPFDTNVSVPKGDEADGIVTQYFIRDPDGYYIEICNCDILTEFCFGNAKLGATYEEGVKKIVDVAVITKLIALAEHAKMNSHEHCADQETLKTFDETDYHAIKVDEQKLTHLLKRTQVYGDVLQGENEESLREILKKTKNHVPDAILYIRAKHGRNQVYIPPAIYANNVKNYQPPSFTINKSTPAVQDRHKK